MNRLKELRKNSGKTQKEVFEETGIPIRSIQNWENGKRQINLESAKQLADYFGVSIGYLLGHATVCDVMELATRAMTNQIELEDVYVEFSENINTVSGIDLEDLKAFSRQMYEMVIAEKTRRVYEENNEI